jgi:signal transduction histidine kinase
MFSIIFISSAVSQVLQALPLLGVIVDSVEMFRIRAFVVLVMVIPMVVVLLSILAPRWRKHHNKITAASAIYWIAATFLGTSREQIMTLVIPFLLVLMIGWLVMFTITWKTGRLKEVRSDLMVFATILSLISQGGKVAMMAMGIGFVADMITAISVITYTVAMVNPWYKRDQPAADSIEVATAMY